MQWDFVIREAGMLLANVLPNNQGLRGWTISQKEVSDALMPPSLAVQPQPLEFGSVHLGSQRILSYQCTTANLESVPVKISVPHNSDFQLASSNDGPWSKELSIVPVNDNMSTRIFVRFEAQSPGLLTVATITHQAENVSTTLTVRAGVPQTRIMVTPASLDMGLVGLGKTVDSAYRVTAVSFPHPIHVTASAGMEIARKNSNIWASTLNLVSTSRGGFLTDTILVRYTATRIGSFSGTINHTVHNGTTYVSTTLTVSARSNTSLLNVQPQSLNFGRIPTGQHRTQTYTINGSNLSETVVVQAPVGFALALDTNGQWGNPLTIPPVNNSIQRTIAVRFTGTSVGTFSGNIIHTGNATSASVSVNAAVFIPQPPVITVNGGRPTVFDFVQNPLGASYSIATLSASNLSEVIVLTPPPGIEIAEAEYIGHLNGQAQYTADEQRTWGRTLVLTSRNDSLRTAFALRFAPTAPTTITNPLTLRSGNVSQSFAIYATNIPPSIQATPDTVTAPNATMPIQNYTLRVRNWTSTVFVYAPSGFEISTTSTGQWSSRLELQPTISTGSMDARVFVRAVMSNAPMPTVSSQFASIRHISQRNGITLSANVILRLPAPQRPVIAPPAIATSRNTIDFGEVLMNNTSTMPMSTYLVSARNLSQNLVVSVNSSTNVFAVALSQNGPWSENLTIAPTNGIVQATLFVRYQHFGNSSVATVQRATLTHTSGTASTTLTVSATSPAALVRVSRTDIDFGRIGLGSRALQNYQVSGTNFVHGVNIEAPDGVMLSTNINGAWSKILTIPATNFVLNPTTIWVQWTTTASSVLRGGIRHILRTTPLVAPSLPAGTFAPPPPSLPSMVTVNLRGLAGTATAMSKNDGGSEVSAENTFITAASTQENTAINGEQMSVYPNPVRDAFTIQYTLPHSSDNVRVELLSLDGRSIATLWNAPQNAGTQSISASASELSRGVYLCRMVNGTAQMLVKVNVVR
jgi:hypothetical protein